MKISAATGDNRSSVGKLAGPRNGISTPAIDLLLMIPGQLNMHDIEWLCPKQTASHLHAVCEFGVIDPAAVDLYLFVNTFNWVYSL